MTIRAGMTRLGYWGGIPFGGVSAPFVFTNSSIAAIRVHVDTIGVSYLEVQIDGDETNSNALSIEINSFTKSGWNLIDIASGSVPAGSTTTSITTSDSYASLGSRQAVISTTGLYLDTISNAITDTDKFLCSDSGTIKYRTGTELLSDIGAAANAHTLDSHSDWKSLDSVNTQGDMICCNSDLFWQKLSAGDEGYYLKMSSGMPTWAAAAAHGVTVSVLPKSSGASSFNDSFLLQYGGPSIYGIQAVGTVNAPFYLGVYNGTDNGSALAIMHVAGAAASYADLKSYTGNAECTECGIANLHAMNVLKSKSNDDIINYPSGFLIYEYNNSPIYFGTNNTIKMILGADGGLAIRDGITAPGASISGMAIIYIDTSDGDLKIRFADDTVKTIVTDS